MKLNLGKKNERMRGGGSGSRLGDRRRITSELSRFLLFLGLASLFWLLQALQSDYATKIYIPVIYDSIPAVNSLQEEPPRNIEVSLQDKGFELLKLTLGQIEPIRLEVKRTSHGSTLGISKKDLTEAIVRKLSTSAQITYFSPTEIAIPLTKRRQKVVPIRLQADGLAAPGYMAYEPELTPKFVTIYGSKEALDTVEYIQVRPLEESQLTRTITTKADLEAPQGIRLAQSRVQVYVRVEEFIEKSFPLTILKFGEPDGYVLNPLPSTATLTITFPRSRYSEFSEADFQIGVDYPSGVAQENDNVDRRLPIVIRKKPEWVLKTALNPETVQYVIEHH